MIENLIAASRFEKKESGIKKALFGNQKNTSGGEGGYENFHP